MLKYRINKNNLKSELFPIYGIKSIMEDLISKEINIVYPNGFISEYGKENPKIGINDEIIFNRTDNNDVFFQEKKRIKKCVESGENITFIIDSFSDILLSVDGISLEELAYTPNNNRRKKYLVFYLSKPHCAIRGEDIKGGIKELLYDDYSADIKDSTKKRCENDYVIYNNRFLYRANGVNDNNRYTFDNVTYGNKCDSEIIIKFNGSINSILEQSGSNWEYTDGILQLKNCITPIRVSGNYERYLLLWENTNDNIANFIINNVYSITCLLRDDRFIIRENGIDCKLVNNVTISKKRDYFELSNLIENDFITNLNQEFLLKEKYVNEIKDIYKNKIIDYEKQIFEAVCSDGNPVSEIKFILNFRERPIKDIIMDKSGNTLYYDYGDWKTRDDLLWNKYEFKNTENKQLKLKNSISGITNIEKHSDLLGYLGFTDDDVYYRKNKLMKSFIRLSFYTTQNRLTQVLLFTSTIFLKEYELYGKYIKLVGDNKVGKIPATLLENVGENRIDAFFDCKGKFRNDLSLMENNYSSEGYYLYLFPSILGSENEATIYMKVEFCHAKYGYTIPFIMPMDENGIIAPTAENFPISYLNNGYIDTKRLFNDMYIPIKIKYNKKKNKYTWQCDSLTNDEHKMEFCLFEPRVNDGEPKSGTTKETIVTWE